MTGFAARLERDAARIEEALDRLLPRPKPPAPETRLHEAMRYAVMEGGKRLRGFLTLNGAALFNVDPVRAARAAVAVECIHAYSLVHDDLPCMDDDDLRRGKPSTHRAFDEATAVLAGDALQTFAFEVLADEATHENPFIRCALVSKLAGAAGARGMVAGQMIDIAAESGGVDRDVGAITHLQRLKTGALIAASCGLGAILGQADAAHRRALDGFAQDLGLAFQIRDDLLDIEGREAQTGKRVGKDAGAGKATFVDLLGVDGARDRARMLAGQARAHLDDFGEAAAPLRAATIFVIERAG